MPMNRPSAVATTKYTIASRYQMRDLLPEVPTVVSTIPPCGWTKPEMRPLCAGPARKRALVAPVRDAERPALSDAATILAGPRVDFDPVARGDEQRHLHFEAA